MPYKYKGRKEAYNREYRLLHPEKMKEYARKARIKWVAKNREKVRAFTRAKYVKLKANPEAYARYLKTVREQRRQRYQVDKFFRLYCNARSKITIALSRGRNQKSGNKEELLGCTILQLKQHLESKFTEGMSWDNKSLWQIDHIRSCVSFDLSNPDEVRKCFHYTNLQPLWSNDNKSKWAHYEGYHHESVSHRVRNQKGQFLPNAPKCLK